MKIDKFIQVILEKHISNVGQQIITPKKAVGRAKFVLAKDKSMTRTAFYQALTIIRQISIIINRILLTGIFITSFLRFKFAVGAQPYGRPQTLLYRKFSRLIFLSLCGLGLSFNLAIADSPLDDYYAGSTGQRVNSIMYPPSIESNYVCHCQHLISEAFIQHSEFDLTRQIYQMNIDQRNFAEHFLNVEMVNGLENELKGVLSSFNKMSATMQDYDELIFLSKKLIKELQITNEFGDIQMKKDLLESSF